MYYVVLNSIQMNAWEVTYIRTYANTFICEYNSVKSSNVCYARERKLVSYCYHLVRAKNTQL